MPNTPNTPPLPGWPVEPEYTPAIRDQQPNPAALYGHQSAPVVHNHYYPAPAPARRGPSPSTVLSWAATGGIVTAALLAVSIAAVGLAIAAVALAILALVLRHIWKDLRGGSE